MREPTPTSERPARGRRAAGVFARALPNPLLLALVVLVAAPGGAARAQTPAYRWEPTGIPVEGEGSLPFFGGLGSGNSRGPRVRLADLDDDGDLDLYVLDKDQRILTYRNDGDSFVPRFVPAGTDLLGELLTDWFLFDDLDADGDLDIVGGEGPQNEPVAFFRNVGSAGAPDFSYEPLVAFLDSVQVIPRLGNTAALADLDADGDHDLLYVLPDLGTSGFHENIGTPQSPQFGSQRLDYGGLDTYVEGKQAGGLSGTLAGSASESRHGTSIPLFFDLDSDADFDILIGDLSISNVWLFTNAGGPDSAEFRFVTDQFLDLPVDSIAVFVIGCDAGDLDGDGLRDLVVAPSMESRLTRDIYFYKNVGTADSAVFSFASDTLLAGIDLGARAVPALGDVDGDGDDDMVVSHVAAAGERALVFYENTGSASAPAFRRVPSPNPFDDVRHDSLDTPTPAFADMDGDLDLDLLVGQGGFLRQVFYFENVGTTNAPTFQYMGTLLDPVRANFRRRPDTYAAPTAGDLDRDGDLDLLVGEYGNSGRPQMYWYRNITESAAQSAAPAAAPLFEWVTSNADSAFGFDTVADSVTGYLVPVLIDRNGDGYLDIVIGSEDGRLREYRSRGAGDSLRFDRVVDAFEGVDVGRASAPAIVDIDADGSRDLLVGEENGGMNFFRLASEGIPTVTGFGAAAGDTLCLVSWTAVAAEGAAFTLWRSEEAGPFGEDPGSPFSGGPGFSVLDDGVFPGNTYRYRLDAVFAGQSGATFGPVAAFLPIPAFSLVSAAVLPPAGTGGAQVTWTVSRSFPGLAFRLSRRLGDGSFAAVAGAESVATGADATVVDPAGSLASVYRLEALYRKHGVLSVVPDSIFAPALIAGPASVAFKAYPARPNPSKRGPVEFLFDLPEDMKVGVVIYDPSGRRVAEVEPRLLFAGADRSLVWDGLDIEGDALTTGLYFYRVTAGSHTETGRLVHFR